MSSDDQNLAALRSLHAAYQRERYEALRDEGKCPRCMEPLRGPGVPEDQQDPHVYCRNCSIYNVERGGRKWKGTHKPRVTPRIPTLREQWLALARKRRS